MDPQTISLIVNAGIGAAGLVLFVRGDLLSKATVTNLLAQLSKLYEARIKETTDRYIEMRRDRDEWRRLALGSERRLDVAAPTVATALGAPVPLLPPAPAEDGA